MLRRVALLLLCCAVLLTDLSSARANHPDLPDTPSTAASDREASDAAPPAASAEAVSVSSECVYSLPKRGFAAHNLYDDKYTSNLRVRAGARIAISFAPDLGAAALYLSFFTRPTAYEVLQYDASGALLQTDTPDPALLVQWLPLLPEAVRVEIVATEAYHISDCMVFSHGALPAFLHDWSPTPDKLDFLVISAHPDDDQLFLGAVAPIYCGRDGLTGTTLFMTCKTRRRYTEALNGCWAAGIRCMPLFCWFLDGRPDENKIWKHWDYDEVLTGVVRMMRRVKPEVVVTHDFNGEYGQPLHKATAAVVAAALPLAADPSYDPDSAADYGAWQVKKLYIHLYAEQPLTLDTRAPIPFFSGLSAKDVAQLGWEQHVSERKRLWFEVEDTGRWSIAEYGLYYSAVGPDSGINDMFEHIPAESLTTYSAPAPSPAH